MQEIIYENENRTFLFSIANQTFQASMAKNHSHDYYEIYYLYSGKRKYFIKDNIYTINNGQLVFINRNDLHRTIDAGARECERLLINFKPAFFMPCEKGRFENLIFIFTKGLNVLELSIKDQVYIEELFFKINSEIHGKNFGFEEIILSLLIQLLVFSARFAVSHSLSPYRASDPRLEKVLEIVQYINIHYSDPLTLFSISKHFYISPYYFCKLFKKYTDFTFTEYLNNLRIKEVRRLLCESDMNIQAISDKAGFGSISHFGRVFKKFTGFSPLHYRKIVGKRSQKG